MYSKTFQIKPFSPVKTTDLILLKYRGILIISKGSQIQTLNKLHSFIKLVNFYTIFQPIHAFFHYEQKW